MKKLLLAVTGVILLLAACSNDPTDYRDAARKAIAGKDAETQLGQRFDNVTCETPTSKEIGTQFTCTATGVNDGVTYTFTAEIKSKNAVSVAPTG